MEFFSFLHVFAFYHPIIGGLIFIGSGIALLYGIHRMGALV